MHSHQALISRKTKSIHMNEWTDPYIDVYNQSIEDDLVPMDLDKWDIFTRSTRMRLYSVQDSALALKL